MEYDITLSSNQMDIQLVSPALNVDMGAIGPAGNPGSAGFRFIWSTDIAATDPGVGKIKVNNATSASVGTIYISETELLSGANLATYYSTVFGSNNTPRSTVAIIKEGDPSKWLTCIVNTDTDSGAYHSLGVSSAAGSATTVPFANGDTVQVVILRTGQQGASPGPQYTYSSTITEADPGSNTFRLNNATPASATKLWIDDLSGNVNMTSWYAGWGTGSNMPTKGVLMVRSTSNSSTWVRYNVTGVTAKAGYYEADISGGVGTGTFGNGHQVGMEFYPAPRNQAPGPEYTYNNTITEADPGANTFRLNNATLSSVTKIWIDNTGNGGADLTAWFAQWASSNKVIKGSIGLTGVSNPAAWARYDVTAVVAKAGYYEATVTHIASIGTFTSGNLFGLIYYPNGSDGEVTSTTTGSDGQVAIYDGVSTKVIKPAVGIMTDSSGNLTATGSVTAANFRTLSTQRASPTVVGDTVEIGTIAAANNGFNLDITTTTVTSGFTVCKRYLVVGTFPAVGFSATTWYQLSPEDSTGAYSNQDYEVDIYFIDS
jgi:hypothetical protein